MSLAGFDFQALNRKYLTQPANEAERYGVSIVPAPAGRTAWRCLGVYHLAPHENNGRHNVFIEVLDERGQRTRAPVIVWTWWLDATVQMRALDKPDDEPAADIPLEKSMAVRLQVGGDMPSDVVVGLHSRHPDEGQGNTWGHHSFYAVFQLRAALAPVDPAPTEPAPAPDLERRVARLEGELHSLKHLLATWTGE